jgi:ABC-type multidrug transport system fused ATPase/permease subunit
LKEGKVQEFGTRQELLRNKGTYYNLLKLQMELSDRNA